MYDNWPEVKARYVNGVPDGATVRFPSLGEVARWFGIPEQTVRAKAAAGGWQSERAAVVATVREAERAARRKDLDALDEAVLNVAKLGTTLIHIKMLALGKEMTAERNVHVEGADRERARELLYCAGAYDKLLTLGKAAVARLLESCQAAEARLVPPTEPLEPEIERLRRAYELAVELGLLSDVDPE